MFRHAAGLPEHASNQTLSRQLATMSYSYHIQKSTANGQFFWNLTAINGKKVASSHDRYVRKADCVHGLNLFRDNAAAAPTNDLTLAGAKPRVGTHEFEVYKDNAGEYRWRFQAANNQVVATSGEGYDSKQGCLNGIQLTKTNSRAPVVDHT